MTLWISTADIKEKEQTTLICFLRPVTDGLWNFFLSQQWAKTHTFCFCASLTNYTTRSTKHANPNTHNNNNLSVTASSESPAKLLKGNTSVWLLRRLPPCCHAMSETQTFGFSCVISPPSPPPAACHHVITVVYWDRGRAQVLKRGHLTAPKVFLLPQASSASVRDLVRLHWGFRKQLLRAGFVGECEHTARLLWGTVKGRLSRAACVATEC